jgi:hypothetical protein
MGSGASLRAEPAGNSFHPSGFHPLVEVTLSRHGFLLWTALLGLVASMTLACGAPADPQPQILPLAVSPMRADAQNESQPASLLRLSQSAFHAVSERQLAEASNLQLLRPHRPSPRRRGRRHRRRVAGTGSKIRTPRSELPHKSIKRSTSPNKSFPAMSPRLPHAAFGRRVRTVQARPQPRRTKPHAQPASIKSVN